MRGGGTMTMAGVSGPCTGKSNPLGTNVPANMQDCALCDPFSPPRPIFPLLHHDDLSHSTEKLVLTCSWSSHQVEVTPLLSLLWPVAVGALGGCICLEVNELCSLFSPLFCIQDIL